MSSFVKDLAHLLVIRKAGLEFTVLKNTHDDSTTAVSASMLSEVVTSRELLAAVAALERFVLSVKRSVVALEVFLSTETSRAQVANEGLGRIFSQRLLATTSVRGTGTIGMTVRGAAMSTI